MFLSRNNFAIRELAICGLAFPLYSVQFSHVLIIELEGRDNYSFGNSPNAFCPHANIQNIRYKCQVLRQVLHNHRAKKALTCLCV